MTTSIKKILALAVALMALLGFAYLAVAEVNFTTDTAVNNYQNFSFFSATTTTATSTNLVGGGGYFVVAGAKTVNVYFSRGTDNVANAGSSRFQIQVSPDGVNWYYFGKFFENASTTSNFVPTTPAGTSFTLSGTSSATVSLNLTNDSFYGVRCIAVETTDGAHTCSASARF